MAGMSPPAKHFEGDPRRFDSLEQEAFLNLWRSYDRLHIAEEELFSKYDRTRSSALRLFAANTT